MATGTASTATATGSGIATTRRRHPGHREPASPERRAGRLPARGLRLQPCELVRRRRAPAAARYRGAAEADPGAARPVARGGRLGSGRCSGAVVAGGPADSGLGREADVPGAYRALPAWAMAAGRAPEPVDARIYDDVIWVLKPLQPARDGRPRGGPPHPRRRHRRGPRARGRRDPGGLGRHGRPARRSSLGWTARLRRLRRAGPPARSSRRSSGSATTATRATARRGPARAAARRTSTSRGCRDATARARSSRRARGSWRSPCPATVPARIPKAARRRTPPRPSRMPSGRLSRASIAGTVATGRTTIALSSDSASNVRVRVHPARCLPPHSTRKDLGCSTEFLSSSAGAGPGARPERTEYARDARPACAYRSGRRGDRAARRRTSAPGSAPRPPCRHHGGREDARRERRLGP